jgi:photosystem II stability/assembly factor-like uncharacterized protein
MNHREADVLWFTDISCPDPAYCVVIGELLSGEGVVSITTDAGMSWSRESSAPRNVGIIACATKSFCVSAGSGFGEPVFVSRDGGKTWVESAINSQNVHVFTGAVCTDSDHCWVSSSETNFRGSVFVTTDGAHNWERQDTPLNAGLDGISCASNSACWAVGIGAVLATRDGGKTWTAQVKVPNRLTTGAVTCVSSTTCWAVGDGEIIETKDAGATWSHDNVPPGIGLLTAVSCADESHCWAVTGGGGIAHVIRLTTDRYSTTAFSSVTNDATRV